MATKRNVSKKEETPSNEAPAVKEEVKEVKEVKQCKKCSCGSCFVSLIVFLTTISLCLCGFTFYLKQYQPELYAEKIEGLIPLIPTSLSSLTEKFAKQAPAAETVQAAESTPVAEAEAEAEATSEKKKLNLQELDDTLNLEEQAYLKNAIKEEEIYEKLKDRPDLLKVKEYYDEPIGQMVKRISLEQQVVLFLNSNDERNKVTRLAISQAKVPYGVVEVDNEPRGPEMRVALIRMTSQRTFPFIFVNGKFFGNSFALQKAMQNGEFYELVDSEENKKNWLLEKEEYHEKIEKRRKQKEEQERKKLEKIKKKIEEKQQEKQEL